MDTLTKNIVSTCNDIIHKKPAIQIFSDQEAFDTARRNEDNNQIENNEILLDTPELFRYSNIKKDVCFRLLKELAIEPLFNPSKDIIKELELRGYSLEKKINNQTNKYELFVQPGDIDINIYGSPISKAISPKEYEITGISIFGEYPVIRRGHLLNPSSNWREEYYHSIKATEKDLQIILEGLKKFL